MKQVLTNVIGKYLNTMAYIMPKTTGRLGFTLFNYPFRAPLKPYHKEFLDTSEKFSLHLGKTYIQCYRWGQGPKKVLFLHGWQSHSFRWKNYIESLPLEDYTCYAFDAPGHGYSKGKLLNVPLYSALIQQFLATMGPMDAVVSHSIGSFSVLHALYESPQLPIGKLVTMASPAEASHFIDLYRERLKLGKRALRLTLTHFEAVIQQPVKYFSAPKFAAGLTIPGLIIHDVHDQEAPYTTALALHEVWKNSTLLSTQGFSHNLKAPEVVAAVKEFIMEEGTVAVSKEMEVAEDLTQAASGY